MRIAPIRRMVYDSVMWGVECVDKHDSNWDRIEYVGILEGIRQILDLFKVLT